MTETTTTASAVSRPACKFPGCGQPAPRPSDQAARRNTAPGAATPA